MAFLGLGLLIQLICAVHVVKTGRNSAWIMVVMFLPLVGALAYFVVEVLPGMQGNRHVRTARAKAMQAIDPEREVRAAREALDLVDTIANHIRLGDAYADLKRYQEALGPLGEANRRDLRDARTAVKLARARFETGDVAGALALIDDADPPSSQGERDRVALLRARILDSIGRKEEALALYADIVERMPGAEVRCRYAALLLDQGWDRKAERVLGEVEQQMKRLDRQQRADEAEMYRWARETLAMLRERSSVG